LVPPIDIIGANLIFTLLAGGCSLVVALCASTVSLTAIDRTGMAWFSFGYVCLGAIYLEWIGLWVFIHGVAPEAWPGVASLVLFPACGVWFAALAAMMCPGQGLCRHPCSPPLFQRMVVPAVDDLALEQAKATSRNHAALLTCYP
jgi:hypothetical protein